MSRKLDAFAHRWGLDQLAFRIWRYNPRGLLRLYRHHAFDRRLGVNTRGYSDLRYEPTPADVFHEMLSRVPFDPRDFTFIDFGSGKGKVLMLAAQYPFRRVMGIELWEDLHQIAVANLKAFRESTGSTVDVALFRMDLADFPIPDEPLALYFFNPVPQAVLERVLSNLKGSLARAPRRVYVLFYAPTRRGAPWDRRSAFEECGFLAVLADDPRFTIYTAS